MNHNPEDFYPEEENKENSVSEGPEVTAEEQPVEDRPIEEQPVEEPRWYGISYQNQGGYVPPMSFAPIAEQRSGRRKGLKIALIAALVAVCILFVAVSVALSGYFEPAPEADAPDTPSANAPTNNTSAPPAGSETVYDEVTGDDYDYNTAGIPKNEDTSLIGHPNGSAGDNAGTTISATAKVKDAVVEILTTTTNRNQTITAGVGSGVIIHADGIIVTNNHVVEGLETIYARLTNGNTYKATVRGTDEEGDIAVIKIEPKETLTVAALGYSGALALGEPVIAIGNPLGELGGTVTHGIISATQRAIQVDGVTMTLIQTDAAINAGNSGGGLFNLAGELIGVVNAKISAEGVEGLGFAIPIDTAIVSINHLIKLGYIPGTPSLGVSVTGKSVQKKSENSLWYVTVYMPCVDENAGELQKGDLIYSVNSTVVEGADAATATQLLKSAIRAYEVGDKVELTIYRYDGTQYVQMKVEVTLIEYVPIEPQGR